MTQNDHLPSDIAACHALIVQQAETTESLARDNAQLLCASLDGYHLGVANHDGDLAFTFDGPNDERLVLSLDAIFDKAA